MKMKAQKEQNEQTMRIFHADEFVFQILAL
jgi:hypothetical protein